MSGGEWVTTLTLDPVAVDSRGEVKCTFSFSEGDDIESSTDFDVHGKSSYQIIRNIVVSVPRITINYARRAPLSK